MPPTVSIGVIGGSGLYQMANLEEVEEVRLDTPYGDTSDALMVGKVGGVGVAFLARHGRHHHLLPREVPYLANIHAMKQLGVKYLISVSAVGSLKESIRPLDLVIPDQFIDRTQNRPSTFFGRGIVAHIAFGEPICPKLAELLTVAAEATPRPPGARVHRGGTYLVMEGPAFSTKAESLLYRQWGASVIGMTNLPEAKLAREAEIAYATLALVTDYDCWHPDHHSVTVEMVLDNLKRNSETAQGVIRRVVALLAERPPQSPAHTALRSAILTDLHQVSPDRLQEVAVILRPYLPGIG
jgi:5'-methylthioadenosine phosphorylase